jgi:hypothetical protein
LTSHLLFLPPVLLYDGSPSVRSRSCDTCGSGYGDGLGDFNVVSRNNTLLVILQPPDLPPLIAGRVIEDQDLITKANCDLVVALGHEVEKHDTLLLYVGEPRTSSKHLTQTSTFGSTC